MDPTPAELTGAVTPVVEGLGFDLLEVKLVGAGRRRIVRIVADRPRGGITHGDCVRITRALAAAFEQTALGRGAYTLEVSSPGLDRRLVSATDFGRYLGEAVTLQLVDGTTRQGTLQAAGEDALRLGEDGEEIPYTQVKYGTRNY